MAYHLEDTYRSALRVFEYFIIDIRAGYAYELQDPISFWRDELGRLRLRGANIELYGSSGDFLDYRLCGPSYISNQIRKIILTELEEAIRGAKTVMTEEAQDTNMIDADGDEDDDDDNEPTAELQQLLQYVETLIRCLYRIATLFKNSAACDRSTGPTSKIMDEIHAYVDRQSPPGIEHQSHTVGSLRGSEEETLVLEDEHKGGQMGETIGRKSTERFWEQTKDYIPRQSSRGQQSDFQNGNQKSDSGQPNSPQGESSYRGQTLPQKSASPDGSSLQQKSSPHTSREAGSSSDVFSGQRQAPPARELSISSYILDSWKCCSCGVPHLLANAICTICNHAKCRNCSV